MAICLVIKKSFFVFLNKILYIDINECDKDVCPHGKCINLEGDYTCDCLTGYKLTYDAKSCIPG